jgi:sugar O-acyltransferase (sialic acid O-acetyltransferase NeuD family)
LDIVEALNASGDRIEFLGFVDDGEVRLDLLARRNAKLLGRIAEVPRPGTMYVIGIGNGVARSTIDQRLVAAGVAATTLVHPSATIGSDTRVADGVIVAAGARVTTNVDLGRHSQFHVNCTVGHDTRVGDFVSVYPGATVSGNVSLGVGVTVGTGANVLPGVSIGAGAYIGAGAVVTKDVAAGTTVVGSPARPLRR